jgi:protein O-GlcNAc transferase
MRKSTPNRGNILLAGGNFDEARSAYQLAIACEPHYAAAHFNLGNLNCTAGEFELALRNYREAIDIKPDFADAFVAMANAFDSLGRTAEAVESYQRHHSAAFTLDQYADAVPQQLEEAGEKVASVLSAGSILVAAPKTQAPARGQVVSFRTHRLQIIPE